MNIYGCPLEDFYLFKLVFLLHPTLILEVYFRHSIKLLFKDGLWTFNILFISIGNVAEGHENLDIKIHDNFSHVDGHETSHWANCHVEIEERIFSRYLSHTVLPPKHPKQLFDPNFFLKWMLLSVTDSIKHASLR